MSAIPSNLYTAPKIRGLKSVETKSITLRPVNASTNTVFSHNGNNQLVFHIPAYANSYVSPKTSFLSMVVRALRDAGDTTTTFRFNPLYPVFERIQVKSSSGMIIADIDDLHILQKLVSNFDPEWESKSAINGDNRVTVSADDTADLVADGVTIQHDILAGLFSQEHYIPVGLFSGSAGHALEITFYLNDPRKCMVASADAYTGNYNYELSNVNFQLEVVKLPESVTQKLNAQIMKGDKVSIPMVNWRSHKSYIPVSSKSVDITISESAHDLDCVMTVILPDNVTNQAGTVPAGAEPNTYFYGGKVYPVESYQFNYADRFYPSQKVELKTNDQRLALMNAIKNLDLSEKPPYVAKTNIWAHQFCIVQSFKTSKEDDFENGLNTSSSGAPLILQLSVKTPDTTRAYRVISFVKQNQTLNIFRGGQTTLTDGIVEGM